MSTNPTDSIREEEPQQTGARLESSALRPPPNRGILKKPSIQFDANETANQSSRLKWDEESLLITEAMRGQAKMKIDEPKTPYIYYNPDTDVELQEEEPKHNLEDMPPLALSEPAKNETVAMEESEDDWQSDADLDSLTEEQVREHKAFEQKRNQHYNMRDAMRRARELMDDEEGEEDEEDEDEDEVNTTSKRKSSKRAIPPVPPLPKL
ncbi:hypothetical protein BDF22DRAFT_686097, partial [Syncephalis plumigaleata]